MKPKVALVIAAGVLSFVLFGVGAILSLKIHPPYIDFGPDVETPLPLPGSQTAVLTTNDAVTPTIGVAGAVVTVPAPAAASNSYAQAAMAPTYALSPTGAAASNSYTQAAMAPTYALSPTGAAVDANAVATISDTTGQLVPAVMVSINPAASAQTAPVKPPVAIRKRTKRPARTRSVRTTRKHLVRRPASPTRRPTGGDGTTAKPNPGGNDVPATPGNNAPAAPGTNGPTTPAFKDSVVSDNGGGANPAGSVAGSGN